MAWQNVEIDGILYSTIDTLNYTISGSWTVYPPTSGYSFQTVFYIRQNNVSVHGTEDFWIIGNNQWGILCHNLGNQWQWNLQVYLNGTRIGGTGANIQSGSGYRNHEFALAFGIDETTQKGSIIWIEHINTLSYWTCYGNLGVNDSNIYTWIKQGILIPYNWQSVLSISGKNGILQSLVQIKEEALNDGEPVSGATVLSFDSLGNVNIPSVIDEQMPVDPSDVTSVTATYLIPALENGTYEGIKLLVKKGSIPTSEQDADKVVNLDEPTSILRIDSKSVGNLDEDSHYYFVVKLVDEVGTEATSEPKDIWTSHSEGWSFDYTGEIQTFTAPKTGIYLLETWGAQGGDASDGTLTARGGYGAYAYGEVLLTQGETLYINVGGQNGYGGGGNPTNIIPIEASVLSNAYKSSYSNRTTPENVGTDYYDSFPDVAQYFETDTCITTGESSKQQLSNDNGSIKFTQPNPYDIMSYTVIPLGGTYNVTNISFTYSKTINTGQIYVGANYNRLCIAIVKIVNAKIQSIDWVFDERENVNKSNVSIDESINAEGNYILIHEASGTVLINDLVLTVR